MYRKKGTDKAVKGAFSCLTRRNRGRPGSRAEGLLFKVSLTFVILKNVLAGDMYVMKMLKTQKSRKTQTTAFLCVSFI